MRQDLDEKLTKKYPNLFRDRNGDKVKTALHWGYACGNGWYPLISKTAKKLEKLILELPENKRKFYKATQVKQKFGRLCLYMYDRTAEMKQIITDAETESLRTCEVCGRPGEIVQIPHRWVTVNCQEHKDIARLTDMEEIDIHWTVKLKALIGK